jgi:ubiquinone biosynthesis protein COQ4
MQSTAVVTQAASKEATLEPGLQGSARYERDVPQALTALAMIFRPWSFANIDQTFRFVFSLAGPTVKAHFDAFVATETGARLIKERPNIVAIQNDREALAAMPEGSFGRAYLDYVNQAGMADAGYFERKADVAACAAQFGWDEDVVWHVDRQAALHDIFHVLGGYDQSVEGEMGVFEFTAGQYPELPFLNALFAPFPLFPPRFRPVPWLQYLSRAYKHGRDAEPIGFADLEALFPLPLDEVRRRLRIAPPEEVHPNGQPRGGFLYRWFDAHVPVP